MEGGWEREKREDGKMVQRKGDVKKKMRNEKDAICQRLTGHAKGCKRIQGEAQMD